MNVHISQHGGENTLPALSSRIIEEGESLTLSGSTKHIRVLSDVTGYLRINDSGSDTPPILIAGGQVEKFYISAPSSHTVIISVEEA